MKKTILMLAAVCSMTAVTAKDEVIDELVTTLQKLMK